MALKDRIRAAVSRKSSTSSPSSSASGTPTSSGYSTPATLSPTPSAVLLPSLLPAATTSSRSLKLSKIASSSSSSSRASRFSLSRYRSPTKPKDSFQLYAPKNFRYAAVDPARVAVIEAWEWEFGSKGRGSICSGVSPYASRRNSLAA